VIERKSKGTPQVIKKRKLKKASSLVKPQHNNSKRRDSKGYQFRGGVEQYNNRIYGEDNN